MGSLLDALRFLTRLPLGAAPVRDDRRMAAAAVWFPLAGAAVGAAASGMYALAQPLWGPLPAAALAALAGLLVTGGLHLDGLADTTDGLARGGSAEDRLDAMRDPRTGALGAAAVAADLLLRTAFLSALPPREAAFAALAAPVSARWAMVAVMPLHRYARPGGGLGRAFAEHVGWGRALAAGAVAAAIVHLAAAACWPAAVRPTPRLLAATVAAAPLAGILFASFVARRLGGLTGDVYGAVNEVAEIAVLAALAALPRTAG